MLRVPGFKKKKKKISNGIEAVASARGGKERGKQDLQVGQPGMKKPETIWQVLMKVFKARLKFKGPEMTGLLEKNCDYKSKGNATTHAMGDHWPLLPSLSPTWIPLNRAPPAHFPLRFLSL